jgi:hypothetical protein
MLMHISTTLVLADESTIVKSHAWSIGTIVKSHAWSIGTHIHS